MNRKTPGTDAYIRIVAVSIDGVDMAIERLLSLLPSTSRQQPSEVPETPKAPRAEDLPVERAIDEVLEYHRTHRLKNTTRYYVVKQKEWKVSTTVLYLVVLQMLTKLYYRLGA